MASRRGQAIDGVLLLDKPEGLSSNHALQRARRILDARKAGHTGTLDPFATGLMILCFGEATKFSAGMFDADKSYQATLRFGAETDTGDLTGNPLGERAGGPWPFLADTAALQAALATFVGPQLQVPPMYSALKRDGKPLYAYARAGIELEREARPVTIHAITLLGVDAAAGEARIEVACSKGTYIRTLGQDIGRALGCGAHLAALRRTRTAGFDLADACTLETLEAQADPAARLLPVDSLLADLPAHTLSEPLAARFVLGQTVPDESGAQTGARVRVRGPGETFLGTARLNGRWVKPERLMAFNKESST
ncbi:tRNA pseudouridine(55) synthase TruB [Verticiella sediminum]|uniref:tRNA pseudouridine synthase B n=1 Tax=Verticiella sediminum TaxID=1247510 RepID=A0A556ABH1_9BURK|nr:tRNA pseudouridine(55) synthase TruB [Verticiella sediminum]TSH90223.1 tRNA pseudouridine(55) synthase TruB [Verticiella sediminum]